MWSPFHQEGSVFNSARPPSSHEGQTPSWMSKLTLTLGLCGSCSGLCGSGLSQSILHKPTLQGKVKITLIGSRIPSLGKSVRGPKLVNSASDWFGLQGALIFFKKTCNPTQSNNTLAQVQDFSSGPQGFPECVRVGFRTEGLFSHSVLLSPVALQEVAELNNQGPQLLSV